MANADVKYIVDIQDSPSISMPESPRLSNYLAGKNKYTSVQPSENGAYSVKKATTGPRQTARNKTDLFKTTAWH